jgi:hypothetical protein
LNQEELLRNSGASLIRVVNDDGQKKGMIIGHIERALDGQTPLSSEITLVPSFGSGRYERHEIIAFAYLLADLLIPQIPATELAFIEPDLKPKTRQGLSNEPRRLAIL